MMRSGNNGKNILKRAGKEVRYVGEKIEKKYHNLVRVCTETWSPEKVLKFAKKFPGLE